jgi:hypothetical protein
MKYWPDSAEDDQEDVGVLTSSWIRSGKGTTGSRKKTSSRSGVSTATPAQPAVIHTDQGLRPDASV